MLKASQTLLNVTDELLDVFENSLSSIIVDNDTVLLVTDNVIIHMTRPYENNISGISLHENKDGGFTKFSIQELYSNTSVDNLKNENNIELAVFIPETLLDSLSSLANITVVTTIFYKDIFFNSETNTNEIVASNVVSVSILEYDEYLTEPIPILFKSINVSNQKCAFWSYGLQSENYTGYWSTLGSDLRLLNPSKYEICYFSHLTNFALLVKSDQIVDENDLDRVTRLIEKYHDNNLGIISNVGCAISVLGIFGIFLTAILFKSWRDKVGTRILMQLCVAILLQIIFLNLAAVDIAKYTSEVFCTAVGVILHYFTIAEFSWMLVAAILQFHRFVTVIGPMPNRIVLKASLVGWGLPLIPLILSCAIDIKSYSNAIEGICYPTETTLYVGVFLPIILIIFANLTVFIVVIRNVFRLKAESRGSSKNNFKYQICLAILLFFLLGLPWIFGLLAELLQHTPFSYILLYLFCLTATLQGFVLFVFYVLLDKSTRILWCNKFKTYEIRERRAQRILPSRQPAIFPGVDCKGRNEDDL
ncbi:hypothetical protein FQA39_LY02248 [Lamprigera yunnana]|nr:hypothetical protein FQA39_LY02248 [Lamprigera yunnana]